MVSHLLNIDEGLAETVAEGLRLKEMPKPADRRQADAPGPEAVAGAEHRQERPRRASPAARSGRWSPTASTPSSSRRWRRPLKAEGAMLEARRARRSAASKDSDGHLARGRREARGRPVGALRRRRAPALEGGCGAAGRRCPAARDFVADAFAHRKFIAYADAATPLLAKAGVAGRHTDEGFVPLNSAADAEGFVAACRKLRILAARSPGQARLGSARAAASRLE